MDREASHQRSLEDLEWSEVCLAIAAHALSDLGRERALELGPTEDQETAQMRLEVLSEVCRLQGEGSALPAGFVRDTSATVEVLQRDGVASAGELSEVRRLLLVALGLDRFGASHQDSAPLVARILTVSEELGPLARQLSSALSEEGTILDEASAGLARAREKLRTLRAQIQKRVDELITRYRGALQDAYFAERDGRYVLPVRADAPFRVEGIVLDTSSSGATLYVEPRELGELGNRVRMAEAEVEREEALVLKELSEALAPHAEEIGWAQDVCVRADLLRACGQFSAQIGAVVVEFDEPGALNLKQARHPLLCLAGIEVVPNDLTVRPDRGLVLSGPNAGGKTVALKTIGLLCLMQATGLPVPAHEESKIGFFSEILCDIGDDQSLSMSLSSFSGHVRRVAQVLDEAGHGTLVLFDELMGGTDPDEGAVLAIATIDELVRAGAALCVTTHYEPLKEHAAHVEHLQNGAVGFDFEKMDPTFRVEMGRPGASSALIVAERHGLPVSITQRALGLMSEVAVKKREETIGLEEQARLLEKERVALREVREEQEQLNRRQSLEIDRLKEARRKALSDESDLLRSEVKEARAEVRRLRHALKTGDAAEIKQLESKLDRASAVVSLGGNVDQALRASALGPTGDVLASDLIRVGARVTIRGFQAPGEVLELPKNGKVRVLVGVMKMSVALSDVLRGAKASPEHSSAKMKPKMARQGAPIEFETSVQAPIRSQDVTLDLRGRRVEESLLEVDHFVDELLRRQEMGGFVLHGHGTGALRDAVRQHLRAHECITQSRPAERDEGGDAFTVFWLSGG